MVKRWCKVALTLLGKYFNLRIWDDNFSIQQKKEGEVVDELKELIQLAQQAVERLERAEELEESENA